MDGDDVPDLRNSAEIANGEVGVAGFCVSGCRVLGLVAWGSLVAEGLQYGCSYGVLSNWISWLQLGYEGLELELHCESGLLMPIS